jgi:cytochrome c oxidase subunit 3
MVIKTIEYRTKWEHHLFPGHFNVYNVDFKGKEARPNDLGALNEHGDGAHHGATTTEHAATGVGHGSEPSAEKPPEAPHGTPAAQAAGNHPADASASAAPTSPTTAPTTAAAPRYFDPLAGTGDEPKIKPTFVDVAGLSTAEKTQAQAHAHVTYDQLLPLDQERVNAFFSVYFMMTGLHGFHVLLGMGLITWVLIRANRNEFNANYFTPVDLVGLYWHLVDLIWIFLFPLLYLIH